MSHRISILIASLALVAATAAAETAATFKSNCALCHGADGSGQTATGKALKVRDLRAPEVQKATDDELFTAISDGKQKMPAFKSKLTADEIHALVGYIRKLKS